MKFKHASMIDFMRVVYSIVIVLHHSYSLMEDKTRHLFPNGHLAVEWFFIVSGILLARSAERNLEETSKNCEVNTGKETMRFLLKKYRGLFPYLTFSWILSFIVFATSGTLTPWGLLKNAVYSIWQLLMLDMSGLDGYLMIGAVWYLSAMFLVMPVLYMWLLNRDNSFFREIGSLLIAVFLYGMMAKRTGNIVEVYAWTGFVYMGVVRAAAGLCLGCFCYRCCVYLMPVKFTDVSKKILTGIEMIGYCLTLIFMAKPWGGGKDWPLSFVIVLLFAIATTISFSGISYTPAFFENLNENTRNLLSPISRAIYFSHGRMTPFVFSVFPGLTAFSQRLIVYLLFSALFGIACVVFVGLWKDFFSQHGKKIRMIFISE